LKDSGLSPSEIEKVLMVGGSTRIPAVQAAVRRFMGKEPDRSVNPDESVALGAAIQGGVLGGEVQDVLLLDITPLSMGIETIGGVFSKIIERNTSIPTCKAQVFSTASDGQTSVEIHALQGERAMSQDNKSLARFQLSGIPPAPRGIPQIEVSFEIDANGILKVGALDKGTGRAQTIAITNSGGLTVQEIERMRKEAESFAEEDRMRRELAEVRNQADSLLYTCEKTLSENRDRVRSEFIVVVETASLEVRAALDNDNQELLRERVAVLQHSLLELGASIYEQVERTARTTEAI
jgi:molecular chaperone DnaK